MKFLLAKLFDVTKNFFITKCLLQILSFYGSFSLELYLLQEFVSAEIFKRFNSVYGLLGFDIFCLIICTLLSFCLFLINKYFWIFIDNKNPNSTKNAS